MTIAIDRFRLVQIGDPVSVGGVSVTPLFPRTDPVAVYIGLDEAVGLGLTVREVGAAGDVGELTVENPTDARVLLHEGEVLVGAKQDRVLDAGTLVGPRSVVRVNVSCVEKGRCRDTSPTFTPAPRAAHPELRRAKAERLAERASPGAAQQAVWAAVDRKARRMKVESDTSALSDTFSAHRASLDGIATGLPLQPGQCGAMLSLSGRPVCFDLVSRPDVFARLYPKLLAGYALDGLEHAGGAAADHAETVRFARDVLGAPRVRGHVAGEARAVEVRAPGVLGAGLELDGEVIQLSAHAT